MAELDLQRLNENEGMIITLWGVVPAGLPAHYVGKIWGHTVGLYRGSEFRFLDVNQGAYIWAPDAPELEVQADVMTNLTAEYGRLNPREHRLIKFL